MHVMANLRIAINTVCTRRLRNTYTNQIHIHPIRIRTLASTPLLKAAESPSLKDSPLIQQLASSPGALLALKEFGQLMKEQGIGFSPERPPSTLQLVKLLANPEFRKGLQKLRDDLAKAGVNVEPENAMEMLKAFRGHDTKSN